MIKNRDFELALAKFENVFNLRKLTKRKKSVN